MDCGASKWQQNFAYDVFGNLNKTVPTGGTGISWLPTYNATTNRYSAIPGATPVYDSNGNLTNDSFHTYAWDAENHSKMVDSVTLIYDALGREVEEQDAGVNTEFVYALGKKIALMNGQTQSKAYIPLPGGTQVKYIGTTISTYRLLDWLGSPRVGSNTNRTYGWGVAYAPFGERYASSGSPMWSFTGANGDTKPDLYDFQFRELHSSQGRWISPDPAGIAAVDPGNPQSWNRYAYVINNPLELIDPLGLVCHQFIDATFEGGLIVSYSLYEVCDDSGGPQRFGGGDRGGGSGSQAKNASDQLAKLLNLLKNCPPAAGMAISLTQMQNSGKVVLTNLGTADGSTSFTGTISIDSTYGITAHNLAHEYFHTIQMNTFVSAGQAGAGAIGVPGAGPFLGALVWGGARTYNSVNSFLKGTPGFGPLDMQAEAFGQQISSQCGLD